MGAVPSVDYSALEMLRGILWEWREKGLHCLVAEANVTVLALLREQLGHELLEQFDKSRRDSDMRFESEEVLSIEDAVKEA